MTVGELIRKLLNERTSLLDNEVAVKLISEDNHPIESYSITNIEIYEDRVLLVIKDE